MEDEKIILSGAWIATMLTYLLGDMFRIISGDSERMFSELGTMTQAMWLGMAALMVIPIVMVVASLTLNHSLNRKFNMVMAAFWFLFNLVGLPTYPSWYDPFLLLVSMGFNLVVFQYAWKWGKEIK